MTRIARYLFAAALCCAINFPSLAAELKRTVILTDGSSKYVTVLVPEREVSRYQALGYQSSSEIGSRESATQFRDQICALTAMPAEVLARLGELYGVSFAEVCASAQAAVEEWN